MTTTRTSSLLVDRCVAVSFAEKKKKKTTTNEEQRRDFDEREVLRTDAKT